MERSMKYERFIGQVHHRLELADQGEAVRATRAVLTTLGERLDTETARNLANYLPMEIDRYLTEVDNGQEFPYREFLERVGDIEHRDLPDANYDAQLLIGFISDFVPEDELDALRDRLPSDFDNLFVVADRRRSAT